MLALTVSAEIHFHSLPTLVVTEVLRAYSWLSAQKYLLAEIRVLGDQTGPYKASTLALELSLENFNFPPLFISNVWGSWMLFNIP